MRLPGPSSEGGLSLRTPVMGACRSDLRADRQNQNCLQPLLPCAFRSYLRRRKVSLSHLLELLHGLLLPVAVPFELLRHQLCHPWSGFNADPSAEQQGSGPAREHVLDRSRHLFAHSPDHLGADAVQNKLLSIRSDGRKF